LQTESLLIHFPSYPFTMDTLRPSSKLASMAASLADAGHAPRVADYGTLQTFERLYPSDMMPTILESQEQFNRRTPTSALGLALLHRWKLRRIARVLAAHHERVAGEIADEIAASTRPNIALFQVNSHSEFVSVLPIVRRLRQLHPQMISAVFGRYLFDYDHRGGRVASYDALWQATDEFACAYLGGAGAELARFVESIEDRSAWFTLPGIAYRHNRRLQVREATSPQNPNDLPSPLYDPAVYPAMDPANKIMLFDVDARGVVAAPTLEFDEHKTEGLGRRMLAAESMAVPHGGSNNPAVEEVSRLALAWGARAFHFAGAATTPGEVSALSYELLARRMNIRYSRDAHVGGITSASISALKASGCSALHFQIDSGSQRLLDDYYGHNFGVTRAERAIRACTFSNLYTIAGFAYPSLEDDYHTRAETVRLIERAKPDAAPISLPPAARTRRTLGLVSKRRAPSVTQGAASGIHYDMFNEREAGIDKRTLKEHLELKEAILELGIPTNVTPHTALLAELAGYSGREDEFSAQVQREMYNGDAVGVATTVQEINQGACPDTSAKSGAQSSDAIELKPFVPYQNVVGN